MSSVWTAVDSSRSYRELRHVPENNGKIQREFGNSKELLNV
jgi:hypothetical protein